VYKPEPDTVPLVAVHVTDVFDVPVTVAVNCCVADVCKDAVAEIEKEIHILKSELVPEEELSLVRNYMMGSLLGSLENVLSHADKFKNLYFSGLGYDYYDRYTNVVKTITSEELIQLANKYLDLDKFYKVIVGKY